MTSTHARSAQQLHRTNAEVGRTSRRGDQAAAYPVPPDIDWSHARATLELVASKWCVAVMSSLVSGPKRHNELLRAIPGEISDRVLIRTLRAMERDGLVGRTVHTESSPPAVSYHLTTRGTSLLAPLSHLARWWQRQGP
ncbi:winged helix-turn-helix transcriptional regulator [Streptomyces oceani]|uniref:winged helix-turn-helix transcriptional regulator n=1 Tax=Streptomyces oceani TaxID=1075402 RepID=UPI0023B90703|nr:helix-turn-helix domain-containing protein [Streptomyces oceani]